MSRESYQPPSLVDGNSSTNPLSNSITSNPGANNATSGSSSAQPNAFASMTGGSYDDPTAKPVQYLCGDCDTKITIKRGDPIRCKECGYRVLYKQRTNRMIQFEAR